MTQILTGAEGVDAMQFLMISYLNSTVIGNKRCTGGKIKGMVFQGGYFNNRSSWPNKRHSKSFGGLGSKNECSEIPPSTPNVKSNLTIC